jgi:hypothetical protein
MPMYMTLYGYFHLGKDTMPSLLVSFFATKLQERVGGGERGLIGASDTL